MMVVMKNYSLAVLVVSLTICGVYTQAIFKLDNSTDSACGKTHKIFPDEEIIFKSSGRTPKDKGFCTTVVYAIGKEDKNCHGMCMSVNSQFINVCHAKVQFKGMAFGKDEDPFKELSCFHRLPREWCFSTNVMTVEVVETLLYAFEFTRQSYNFSVTVSPVCDGSPFGKDIQAREDAKKEKEKDSRTLSRVHGILVGVCLAIMFLIILLITWCYYKNKPFRRDIHNYPTAHVRKGPSLAGFKAKMTFHKAAGSEEGETKHKKDKKHKASKDEATTENEEPKPKKRGFGFLNKLRSNRAEEVPLVEKKEETKEEDKPEEINEDENLDKKSDKGSLGGKDIEKPDEDDTKKPEGEGEITKTEETEDREGKGIEDVPSVTVTTPGDEDEDKHESSNDS